MPSLKETQTLLWQLITARKDVAETLREMPGIALPVKPNARLTATERVQIYAESYFARILESLQDDFPGVVAAVGPTRFQPLILDYLAAYPPTHFSLRYAGQQLARFLETHAAGSELPYLADLARFEYALLDRFDAADAPILTEAMLREVTPEQWPALTLQTIPATQVLRVQWPVDQLHEAAVAQDALPTPQLAPTDLLIWRRNFTVVYRRVAEGEVSLLELLCAGTTFEALCEAALACGTSDEIVHTIGSYMQHWVREELLAAPSAHAHAKIERL